MGVCQSRTKTNYRTIKTFLGMELTIIRITHTRFSGMDISLLKDDNQDDEDFIPPKSGDYALVKIETLNDRIAVEEFIENLKNTK